MIANIAEIEAHRPALLGYCYRMLGSAVDAEDAAQESVIRAWRNTHQFDGRASLKTWLYRIATNVCLDEIAGRKRRAHPVEEGSPSSGAPPLAELVQRPGSYWIEPIADGRVMPRDADPAEQLMLKQSIRLAFIAALQHLPAKQRAVLLLTEVLGWPAAETAETLGLSAAAVNSALQRARASLAARDLVNPGPLTARQRELVDEYAAAFERFDVDGLVRLLTEDVTLSMPPYAMWMRGPEAIRTWLNGMGSGCRGSRLIPTEACGAPAFGQYRSDGAEGFKPWALIVLEVGADRIASWTAFLDTETLFPRFELPHTLPLKNRHIR